MGKKLEERTIPHSYPPWIGPTVAKLLRGAQNTDRGRNYPAFVRKRNTTKGAYPCEEE